MGGERRTEGSGHEAGSIRRTETKWRSRNGLRPDGPGLEKADAHSAAPRGRHQTTSRGHWPRVRPRRDAACRVRDRHANGDKTSLAMAWWSEAE